MDTPKIQIYSTPSCKFCIMAKEYFADKKLAYESYDVSVDPQRQQEMMALTGELSVPVIVINGEVVRGFDKGRIEALLNHDVSDYQDVPWAA